MIPSRQIVSPSLIARLSSASLGPPNRCTVFVRCLSSSGGGGKKGDDDNDEDPFGVFFDDGKDPGRLGPTRPPSYVRDSATGKMTGDIVQGLTDEERNLMSLDDDDDKDRLVVERLIQQWKQEQDEVGDPVKQGELADRIREEDMALSPFGRSGPATELRGVNEKGEATYHDDFSQPLSPEEFKTFSRYLKQKHNVQVGESDIPVHYGVGQTDDADYADNPDLDLKWLTSAAQREIGEADDPFLDLMPQDLNPARLVNRKRAKLIPRELLHHNNLSLLRRYVTPGGQIMNRVQSRLGAKDQRKMAKLIKRARALGLIPYVGQWRVENHGNRFEKDIHEDKEWEKELKKRGLVVRRGKDEPTNL